MSRLTSTIEDASSLKRYVIPNLRNACLIMKLLAQNPEGLKAAEIARNLKLPVTTTLRIMATLQTEGYVRKMEGRFELGPVLIHLGNASLAGTEIRTAALPVLQELTNRTDETSHLAVPCDDRALASGKRASDHRACNRTSSDSPSVMVLASVGTSRRRTSSAAARSATTGRESRRRSASSALAASAHFSERPRESETLGA